MAKITFHYWDRRLSLKNKTVIKQLLLGIFTKEKKTLSALRYIFCSDDSLLKINQDHLQHDYYTDIITFDLSEGKNITGEVYVSVDRVKENSIDLKVGYEEEMLRVLIHGALHLCGFNDKLMEDIKQMRNKENLYLRLYKQLSTKPPDT